MFLRLPRALHLNILEQVTSSEGTTRWHAKKKACLTSHFLPANNYAGGGIIAA